MTKTFYKAVLPAVQSRRLTRRKQQLLPKRFLSQSEKEAPSTSFSSSDFVPKPTPRQLRIVALRSAIPMVGFGFMDNLVMIQAGEAIDMSIGVSFGLSTMTAAGFGQCVSDVAGFTSGGIVDAAVTKLNLPHHNLTPAQLNLASCRAWHTLGGCVGVVTGCLLGMSCLLFMDTSKADRAKKAKKLQSIFASILEDGHNLVDAERATLWMLDEDKKTLWSQVRQDGVVQAPVEGSIVGHCIKTGQVVNVENAYENEHFHADIDKQTGFHTESVLVVPVLSEDGGVIGAIQMINKKDENGKTCLFEECDIKIVQMLCKHVSSFLRIVQSD